MTTQKQASVDALGRGIEFLFHKNKVDRIDGCARFTGPRRRMDNAGPSPLEIGG
jgi:pyruvate/2-oxoglutarate dehydrogenase complex dihydrolipoamide dehydrogenase (E3) component